MSVFNSLFLPGRFALSGGFLFFKFFLRGFNAELSSLDGSLDVCVGIASWAFF